MAIDFTDSIKLKILLKFSMAYLVGLQCNYQCSYKVLKRRFNYRRRDIGNMMIAQETGVMPEREVMNLRMKNPPEARKREKSDSLLKAS